LTELHVRTEAPPLTTTGGFALKVTAGTTLTVTEARLLVPPAPVQVNEYRVGKVSGPVPWLPLGDLLPLQPPVAVQEVAPVELHASTEVPPAATDGGVAVSVAVARPDTVTVAVATALGPPAPVQVKEYMAVALSAPVDSVPLVALVPLHAPEAVHDVALVELHVSVDNPPLATVVGFAVNVAVAAGAMLTVALAGLLVPPAPLHVNEKVVAAVRAPVL
jgi:hypothetical protein